MSYERTRMVYLGHNPQFPPRPSSSKTPAAGDNATRPKGSTASEYSKNVGKAIWIAALARGGFSRPERRTEFRRFGSQSMFNWVIWVESSGFALANYHGWSWRVDLESNIGPLLVLLAKKDPPRPPKWRLIHNWRYPGDLERFPIYMTGMAKIGNLGPDGHGCINDLHDTIRPVVLPRGNEDFVHWIRRVIEALKRNKKIDVNPELDTDAFMAHMVDVAETWYEKYDRLPRTEGWRAAEAEIPRDYTFCQ
ncbi:hypothetical protein NA57DRAFT_51321 [Rhizodiscina lignyota]|uniref:Uncharacterized protein n=1 Tax=Rhizodiscina lignyota TaxID=1504668 RepID=A0A9P4MBB9_9PEZI|nr:hypothetical protein NA57DRAFT_51321 [Rhizodiscina lignyota]